MGLTNKSTGINASETKLVIKNKVEMIKLLPLQVILMLEKALFSMG